MTAPTSLDAPSTPGGRILFAFKIGSSGIFYKFETKISETHTAKSRKRTRGVEIKKRLTLKSKNLSSEFQRLLTNCLKISMFLPRVLLSASVLTALRRGRPAAPAMESECECDEPEAMPRTEWPMMGFDKREASCAEPTPKQAKADTEDDNGEGGRRVWVGGGRTERGLDVSNIARDNGGI